MFIGLIVDTYSKNLSENDSLKILLFLYFLMKKL